MAESRRRQFMLYDQDGIRLFRMPGEHSLVYLCVGNDLEAVRAVPADQVRTLIEALNSSLPPQPLSPRQHDPIGKDTLDIPRTT